MRIEHVRLGDDGRIVIPAAARRELGLKPGAMLTVESDGDSLLVRSHDDVLREDQDYFRQFAGAAGVVDDLIAGRRAEGDEAERPSRAARG